MASLKPTLVTLAVAGISFSIPLVGLHFWLSPQSSAQRPLEERLFGEPGFSQAAAPDSNFLGPGKLRPVHPDEPVEATLEERFSYTNSLERLEQIEQALDNFRGLTASAYDWNDSAIATGNTDWETQNLGFTNWVGSVEGTLRYQELQIKQLELELARQQFADREISQAVLDEKTAAYETAQDDFQRFWQTFSIAD